MTHAALIETLYESFFSVGNQRNGAVLHIWSEARGDRYGESTELIHQILALTAHGDEEKLKLPSPPESMEKLGGRGRFPPRME